MPRKGENIYLRKDGRWEGRYIKGRRPDGKIKFGSIYGKQYSDV
ncbi:MAG: site-specific integrase, partial [Lachnospiraceae bacterium]